MKKSALLLTGLLVWSFMSINIASASENQQSTDSIVIQSTPDLYNLSKTWASEYTQLVPETKIRVVAIPGNEMKNKPAAKGSILFVNDEIYERVQDKSAMKVIVGRDVIVPVVSSANPFLDEIVKKGISPGTLAGFLNDKSNRTWGTLLKDAKNNPAHFYLQKDESIKVILGNFLNKESVTVEGEIETGDDFISLIQKDPYGIGFCRMVKIIDFENQKMAEQIKLLPLDRNGNGSIDFNENIYDDLNLFSRGVWIGKYPKSLFSNIYSVSLKQSGNTAELAFLKWVLTEGQEYLYNNGYSDLIVSERQSAIDKLFMPKMNPQETSAGISPFLILSLIVVSILLFFYLIDAVVRFVKRKRSAELVSGSVLKVRLDQNALLVPKGLFFDRSHTWAFMEQNGLVKVGIDDFLQHITGSLTRIKVKSAGEKIKKGEYILSIIRNGKQLNIYSPVTGTIRETNKNLDTDASLLNSSPYNLGWVYRIETSNWLKELQFLQMSDKYAGWLKKEFVRMKDFLAVALSANKDLYSKVILQDGGELVDSTLADLGPEIWDDFQTRFIDVSN